MAAIRLYIDSKTLISMEKIGRERLLQYIGIIDLELSKKTALKIDSLLGKVVEDPLKIETDQAIPTLDRNGEYVGALHSLNLRKQSAKVEIFQYRYHEIAGK